MKSKVGLRAQKKTVHGKHGTSIRTYWVKTETAKGNRPHTALGLIKKHPVKVLGHTFLLGVGAGAGAEAGSRLGGRYNVPRFHTFVGGLVGASAAQELARRTNWAQKGARTIAGPYKSSGEVVKLNLAQIGSMYAGYKLARWAGRGASR